MNQTVTVDIPYTIDTGEKLVNETFGPNNIRRRKTGTHDLMRMEVQNGRLLADQLSLEQQGFVFVEHKTKVADFFDAEQLKSVYYPEVEELIKNASGASRVAIFDHTLRSGDETEREAKLIREPVLSAHNDYTEWSGPNRVREFSGGSRGVARASFRDHSSVARNQSADPEKPPGRCRRQEHRAGRPYGGRAPLPAQGGANVSPEVQPQSSMVLFSRNEA